MIISREYRFIYIKTMKTAGSTLAAAFRGAAGEGVLRAPRDGDDHATPLDNEKLDQLGQHAFLRKTYKVFGPEISAFRVVTSERNPFDKLVSAYFFRGKRLEYLSADTDYRADFANRLRAGEYDRIMSPKYYTLSGKILADHVIRYEHLHEDFAEVVRDLGLPAGSVVSHTLKTDTRPDLYRGAKGVQRLFDDELVALVQARFPHYFGLLGYQGIGSGCPKFVPHARLKAKRARFFKRQTAKTAPDDQGET